MSELNVFRRDGAEVVDSREVAKAVGKDHCDLLKTIHTYIRYLTDGKISFSDFFVESGYKDSTGRELPCYLITKKGCDMIANKLTGKKGVLFTATYVNAFERMHERLVKAAEETPAATAIPRVSPSGLAKLITVSRRIMLDDGATPRQVAGMLRDVFQTFNVAIPEYFGQIPGQLCIPGMESEPAI